MDQRILLFIHQFATPRLDHAFLWSNLMGTLPFCAAIVLGAAGWHLRRHQQWPALLWVSLGISTYVLQVGIKAIVNRSRPDLWERLILVDSPSFPSGHAMAAATFYPLLAWSLSRFVPRLRVLWWTLGVGCGLFIGFGRMYLGVHWPTDVMAGWAIGAGQTIAGLALMLRREEAPPGLADQDILQPTDPGTSR
jgi:membrane-associated phospholipid phosphatase